jgi:DNA-binding winged helix-turn-helix (wHTH) protein/tetratricopeptide (TPR) repeat protein
MGIGFSEEVLMVRDVVAYEFGDVRIDLRTYRVSRRDEPIRLEPKAFELLKYLIENGDRVVEKRELLDALWKDSFVTENALTRVVAQIRKRLGAGIDVIETVPKRGYRFSGQADPVRASGGANPASRVAPHPVPWRPQEHLESVAVLPFENVGGDPDVEFLSDGLAESLIHALSGLAHVRVMARSTVFRFKGLDAEPHSIGRQLGVGMVVTGRLVVVDERLAISVELVDVSDGAQVWGTRREYERADLPSARTELAGALRNALERRVALRDDPGTSRHETESARAFEAYLRGRHAWNEKTLEGLRRSIEFFEAAICEDPRYARAHAGLADAYSWLGTSGYVRPRDVFPRAKEAALRAVELDSESAEAFTSLAAARINWDWDWTSVGVELERAVLLDPRFPPAHCARSQFCIVTGRSADAIVAAERARELDPLGRAANLALGWAYYFARQFDDAVDQFSKTLELRPDLSLALYGLGESLEGRGDLARALTILERAKSMTGEAPSASLGHLYAHVGRWTDALKELDRLLELSTYEYVSPFHVAVVYVGLGNRDRALDWLERAHGERSGTITSIGSHPRFDGLRSEPRFVRLVEQIALGE